MIEYVTLSFIPASGTEVFIYSTVYIVTSAEICFLMDHMLKLYLGSVVGEGVFLSELMSCFGEPKFLFTDILFLDLVKYPTRQIEVKSSTDAVKSDSRRAECAFGAQCGSYNIILIRLWYLVIIKILCDHIHWPLKCHSVSRDPVGHFEWCNQPNRRLG